MAKRGGLGRGLDALIPDRKPEKSAKQEKSAKKKKSGSDKRSSGKGKSSLEALEQEIAEAMREEDDEAVLQAEDVSGKDEAKSAGTGTQTGSAKKPAGTKNTAAPRKTTGTKAAAASKKTGDTKAPASASKKPAGTKTTAASKKSEDKKTAAAPKKSEETKPAAASKKPAGSKTAVGEAKAAADAEAIASVEVTAAETVTEDTAAVAVESKATEKAAKAKAAASKDAAGTEGSVISMRISKVEPNRDQPRKYFDDQAIEELADSVRQFGIIQPLLVQEKDDYYEIIAGERRWRAAQKAGLKEVPVIIKNFTSQEAVEVSLIENIQREDLNPIEEAKAYERLVRDYGLSQEAVAGRVSKSRSSVTNSMRLLRLEESVQGMVETGAISEGHARAILGLTIPEEQKITAERVAKEHLSVRQTEKLVRDLTRPGKHKARVQANPVDEAILMDLAEQLKNTLGTKVTIRPTGKKGGKIEIEYYSDDDLDRLFTTLHGAG